MTARVEVAAAVDRMADLAWAAGVLDARGSFRVHKRRHPGGWTPAINVKAVTIVGYNGTGSSAHGDPLILKLIEILGGGPAKPRGAGLMWQLTGARGCAEAIDAVLPYMVVRLERAVKLRRLCVVIRDYERPEFDKRTLPQLEVDTRQHLADALLATPVWR